MDFQDVNRLSEYGFKLAGYIAELQVSCNRLPCGKGVYLIVRDSDKPPSFTPNSIGGYFKHKDPTVPVDILRKKWVDGPRVLYVGKAGGLPKENRKDKTSIQQRVHTYMQFGLGKPCSHWGGRYIWQLEDAKELRVYCQELTGKIVPKAVEKELLLEFKNRYGRLPFANLRL